MELEILLKQYDNTLTQYNQLNSEYLTYIKNTDVADLNKDLISISNNEYAGTDTTIISQTYSSDIEACKASCSTTTGCSGATFNVPAISNENNCLLKSGEGEISVKDNYYAIVTKKLDYLNRLKSLNSQLTTINTNITNYITTNKSNMVSQLNDNQNVISNLNDDLSFLVDKKNNIDSQIRSIKTLDSKIEDSSILVNMNYSIFNILLFVAILAIIMFFYMYIFSNSNNSQNDLNLQNGESNNIFSNLIFLIIIVICGFLAWNNKTTIENWFKKKIFNSSYLI
jgi:hypothetical protein